MKKENNTISSKIEKIEIPKEIAINGIGLINRCISSEDLENDFTWELFYLLVTKTMTSTEENNKNVMISEYSITILLYLMTIGAKEQTKSSLLKYLHKSSIEEILRDMQKLMLVIENKNDEKVDINVYNSVWLDKAFQINNGFKDVVEKHFKAIVNNIDIGSNQVNDWVKEKTKGKIQKVVNSQDNYHSLFINVIQFDGTWDDEFRKDCTKKSIFTNFQGNQQNIDMMMMDDRRIEFYGGHGETFKFAKKKFGTSAEAIFVLPNGKTKNDLISCLEEISNLEMINNDFNGKPKLFDRFDSCLGIFNVPRFEFSCETDLKTILKDEMEMKNVFENANFSAIVDIGQIIPDGMKHDTFIKIDEKGVSASASTLLSQSKCGSSSNSLEKIYYFDIILDRPFLFFVRHLKTKIILFSILIQSI